VLPWGPNIFLIFNTPVTRLGSGFLIGAGSHVFTYYDLVKEASFIKAMFPNEDDILGFVWNFCCMDWFLWLFEFNLFQWHCTSAKRIA